jgi:hypothetical protein
MSDQDQSTPVVQVEVSLQGWGEGQKRLSKTGNGPTPIGDEVAPASEKELQFGEGFLSGHELT